MKTVGLASSITSRCHMIDRWTALLDDDEPADLASAGADLVELEVPHDPSRDDAGAVLGAMKGHTTWDVTGDGLCWASVLSPRCRDTFR